MANLTDKQVFIFQDSIYLLSALGTWGAAQAEAQSYQGNLVTVNDAAEQTFLAGLFAGQNRWIGYNDAGVEGTFQWVSGENSAYTNWAANQPDNNIGGQDFAILSSTGSWEDVRGTGIYRGIIEIKNPANPVLMIEDLGIVEPYDSTRQAVFKVRRLGNSSNSTTVNYSTANGTGLAGVNYTATNGTLTFNPGETEKTITVTVNRDADVTSGETFLVNLDSPINAFLGDNQSRATIREAPEAVTFKGKTYLLTNPGNWGEVQQQARSFGGNLVTINSAEEQAFLAGKYAGQNLWIGYSDAGKEYDLTTREGFQWVSGESSAYTNWGANQPDNNIGGQDFTILSSTGNWEDVAGTGDYRGIVEIPSIPEPLADLGQRQIYTFRDSIYLSTTPKNWGTAQVEAQSYQGNLVTVNDAAEQTFLAGLFAGQDLWIGYNDAGKEGTFQWVSGESSAYTNWGANQPDNNIGGQDFAVLRSTGSWEDVGGTGIYRGIIEIKNPAVPILVIEDRGIVEPVGGIRQEVFTVRRYGDSSNVATVNYSTADGTTVAGGDYFATSDTLTFNPGETTKTISVTVSQDADAVSEETFFVNLSSPTNAILGDSQAKATVREATETVTFGDKTYLLSTASNWGEAQQQARSFGGNLVTINSAEEQAFLAGKYAGQNLWIGYSDAGKEYDPTTREGFQWVSGESSAYTNWGANQPDNNIGGQDFTILSSNGRWDDVSGTGNYKGIIEIPNPAPPTPTLSVNDQTVSEANGKATFTVTLSQPTSKAITVDYQTVNGTATAGSDYGSTAGKLTFAPGETAKNVDVAIINDANVESNETFTLVLSNPTEAILADAQGLGTIQNDDTKDPKIVGTPKNDILVGSVGNDTIIGEAGQDNLNGEAGNDQLNGGAGSDILTGGAGKDRFVFDLGKRFSKKQMGVDQISDFKKGEDKIVLDRTTYTKLRQPLFASVKNAAQARTSDASITYLRSTGALFYNENGGKAGFGSGGQFADLANGLNLTKSDLVIVK
ncbi:Calx-beta domain-containing protein [Leptolyngbya sp. FACHB-711]|uniref:Calx-beta domain-containing protein n=1 Tax=Leptolyngbya sp. FACHB-711 TaxID=2692813 RepID=UPI001686AFF3|nr:Calx-beta domain-containing protein [Leptolyngbya sp. FACHB-711]MBD2028280.1 hypothetical protein [Leptolyngbya sp. FACHB-711]